MQFLTQPGRQTDRDQPVQALQDKCHCCHCHACIPPVVNTVSTYSDEGNTDIYAKKFREGRGQSNPSETNCHAWILPVFYTGNSEQGVNLSPSV